MVRFDPEKMMKYGKRRSKAYGIYRRTMKVCVC
jgi:hypothetical protein